MQSEAELHARKACLFEERLKQAQKYTRWTSLPMFELKEMGRSSSGLISFSGFVIGMIYSWRHTRGRYLRYRCVLQICYLFEIGIGEVTEDLLSYLIFPWRGVVVTEILEKEGTLL